MPNFTESYNYLSNDQPIRIHLKVDCDIELAQLAKKIAQIREVNLDATMTKTELIIFSLDA